LPITRGLEKLRQALSELKENNMIKNYLPVYLPKA
jgi:hypothetical protein